MPLHFLSRRKLLAGVAAGTAGLLKLPALADGPGSPRRCWALLADSHIDQDDAAYGHGAQTMTISERFRQVVRDILESKEPVAGVLINGDLAHADGKPLAYNRLLGLCYPLRQAGIDVHLILGNHDNRENLIEAAHANRPPKLYADDRYISVFESGGVRWILLDSLIRPNHIPGELGEVQRDWLRRTLEAKTDVPTVIFLHHNLDGGLNDAEQVLEIIGEMKHVKAVFEGHNHQWARREHGGLHLVKMPAVGYCFDEIQPIGYLRGWFDRDGCRLEVRAIDGVKKLHGTKYDLKWRT